MNKDWNPDPCRYYSEKDIPDDDWEGDVIEGLEGIKDHLSAIHELLEGKLQQLYAMQFQLKEAIMALKTN